ncbi:MAG: LPS assembly protein LptD [Acidobacteriota bacterium]
MSCGTIHLHAQTYEPTLPPQAPLSEQTPKVSPDPNERVVPPPPPPAPTKLGESPEPPLAPDEYKIDGTLDTQGGRTLIRKNGTKQAHIQTLDMELFADEIDIDENTHLADARGNISFVNHSGGEKMSCKVAHYNIKDGTGTFYEVTGSAPSKIEAKPGMLTTTNPFYFEGEWAEKLKTDESHPQYILHNGFVTDCKPDNIWWKLHGSKFDIIPRDRAIAFHSWMYMKGIPYFYFPAFYKSLKKQDRRSGFLTPNIGNSSLRGQTVGVGYFWAINRSYDLMYRAQIYTKTGLAHQADFRGIIRPGTSFDASVFGSNGSSSSNTVGGYLINVEGKSTIGKGWEARGELRQLSSFQFRQSFTQSFDEAINSETHSLIFLTKHASDYGFNFVAQRNINYQTATPGDLIQTRKLPEAQMNLREHQLANWPVYLSFESSYGLEHRSQPEFQTRQFVQRADFAPRLMTAFHWKGFDLAPSFAFRNTFYGSSLQNGKVVGNNLLRSSRDVGVELALPTLARIYQAPKWLHAGDKLKHTIETRATYRYVTGVDDFSGVPRFDEVDLLANTNEVQMSVTNRVLQRNGSGGVSDLFSWQLWYKRYFDPTFGGAVQPGLRNVVQSSSDITGYAFLNGPRNQSPIVSVMRTEGRVSLEWRMDYDPMRHQIVNSGISVNTSVAGYNLSMGKFQLNTDPVLAPKSNQLRGQISRGGDNKRGWNYGVSGFYDYLKGKLQYVQSQVTYNTDCCGFSMQYRRFNYAITHDNQFRLAFAISNFGSFGTLRKQERIF